MPLFSVPMALLALASLPVLLGIYHLRSRHRRRVVSSVVIWRRLGALRGGGTHVDKPRLPPVFFLELLILAALALAAAGPRFQRGEAPIPLALVLDDSYSMRALGADGVSARSRTLVGVGRELRGGRYAVSLVLAGAKPKIIGELAEDLAGFDLASREWRCSEPEADIAAALGFAKRLVGVDGLVLVASDRAPNPDEAAGGVRWLAFGEPADNAAITGSWRRGGQSLVEIANYSRTPRTVDIELSQPPGAPRISRVQLAAGDRRRLWFDTPGAAPARFRLPGGDSLAIDDEAVLLDPTPSPVAVALAIRDDSLRAALEGALAAADSAARRAAAGEEVELFFTDAAGGLGRGDPWICRFVGDGEPMAYAGPFIVDWRHPMADGLSLDGVVWGARRAKAEDTGRPIIMAGDTILLGESIVANGGREIRVNCLPGAGTLQRSPDWPIMIWNALNYRMEGRPGVREANLRLGREAEFILPRGTQTLRLTRPDGGLANIKTHGRELRLAADEPGLWLARFEGDGVAMPPFSFAVNAGARGASDLRGKTSGRWGGWEATNAARQEFRSAAWILGLLAALALVSHLVMIGKAIKE